jgi:hypothetical protein
MIDLDELSAHLIVQTNTLNDKRAKQALSAYGVTAMRTTDFNGITCRAEGCFSKAEYFGSKTHFCESHMLIKVGA